MTDRDSPSGSRTTDADRPPATGGSGGTGDEGARSGACVSEPPDGTPARTGSGPLDAGDGVPDFVGARDHVRESLVKFARSLRRAGADVPANAATEAARALVQTGFDEDRARAALRATLVTRRADIDVFDRQFPEFWRRLTAGLDGSGPADRPTDAPDGGLAPLGGSAPEGESPSGDGEGEPEDEASTMRTTTFVSAADGDEDGDDDEQVVTTSVYSETGAPEPLSVPPAALRVDDDLAGPMRRLTRAIADLAGRRWVGGGDRRIDTRQALRESFGTGGAVMDVPRKDRKRTAVRTTLLVDVSQSVLDTVDRGFLLGVIHRAVAAWRDVRVFFFDEGLREVTDAFRGPTTADAVRALERAETEWGGGTRIGDAVGTLRAEFPDAVDRNTVTFVVSDGLETGDVDDLESNVAWLSRQSGALLWCNPLAGSPEYEPAARGMAAAVPYLDGLFAFSGPGDVAEMARQLRLHGTGGSIGYEHDPRRRGHDNGEKPT